ncbi:helix-turn-helix domain-containing protein [Veronia pacifica]|uniref:HTH araC/xylS-type domain-containing protein n=1 Tax=Veronia pacifica TaxID=1080227 RepID=A0A1C3EMD8_9GAMM|nr:AraC family transcriptional regulator [Veronia pacifica]ODA34413.1 hypothetical protein A8L45_06610 [Veronia pacifica]
MKPQIEAISSDNKVSWRFARFDWQGRQHKAGDELKCSGWHYHNEYELVLYQDPDALFTGNIFAGDYIGEPSHNTMLLYGPGLPHMISGRVNTVSENGIVTYVLWFSPQWIEEIITAVPALSTLRTTLDKSTKGLTFSQDTVGRVADIMNRNPTLLGPARQFSVVIDILLLLAEDTSSKTVNKVDYGFVPVVDDRAECRVDMARRYIEQHYQQPIYVADLCRHLHMSESSVYRLFERHFLESLSEHIKNYRVGKACELLIQTKKPISWIAQQAGFANLSNFNRHFKEIKGVTPSHFRRQFYV